ncbi:MAG TPA: DUF6067 family protein [Armatimonadota bacterium]|nr:DUF6067 family protein [Armatimonadota bacterium]
MKSIFGFLSILMLLCGTIADASTGKYRIFTVPGTSKYLQTEIPAKSIPVDLCSVRNEYEPFQIIIRADSPISSVSLQTSALKSKNHTIAASNIQTRLAHYIEVTDSTNSQYVNGFYPDALLPMPDKFSIEEGKSQMVWVNIYVPKSAKPGNYTGKVTVNIDGAIESIPVQLNVRDITLPVENHLVSAFDICGRTCADHYGITPGSPDYQKMMERYYWFLVDYRLSPSEIPVALDSKEAGKYLNDRRITSFRIPYTGESEDAKKLFDYLRKKGWLKKGYIYTMDEPGLEQFPECKTYGETINSLAKDAKWLLTVQPHETLEGAVDIWCPGLADYDRYACSERQKAGEHIWWHAISQPQHPFPTYLINDSSVSPRILSWFQSLYRVDGVMYWSNTFWKDSSAIAGATGEGYLIYPGKTFEDDPIPSLRLEMIRQGIEDYELLYILQERYKRLANAWKLSDSEYDPHSHIADIVGKLGGSLMDWSSDAVLLEYVRKSLMYEIESITCGPKIIFKTFRPEGVVRRHPVVAVCIWAELGTKASISFGESKPKPVNFKPIAGKKYIRAELEIPVKGESMPVILTANKGYTGKCIIKQFGEDQWKVPSFKPEDVLCGWTSQADVDKWTPINADIKLTDVDKLGKCAVVTYHMRTDFPKVQFMHPKAFSNPDWSSIKYVSIPFYNPIANPLVIKAKAYDLDGKAIEFRTIMLEPYECRTEKWSLDVIGKSIDIKRLKGFELYGWYNKSPVIFYIGELAASGSEQ